MTALVIANDSDLAEALKVVKARSKLIGLISPKVKFCPDELKDQASFVRNIRSSHLRDSQFPTRITMEKNSTITKPIAW